MCVSPGWWLLPAGQLQQLMSLPWAGVLQLKRDKLLEPVPVVEVNICNRPEHAALALHSSLVARGLEGYNVCWLACSTVVVGATVGLR